MSPIYCLRQAVRCQLVYAVAVKGKQGVLREISVDRQTPPQTVRKPFISKGLTAI